MTFEELERKLSNGFHDAAIREINFDFIGRSVVMGMDIRMGGPDDPDPELYRLQQPHHLFYSPVKRFNPAGSGRTIGVVENV